MSKFKKLVQREEGQSLVIVGALLIVLIALIGLVVDAGNAYAQRRIVQNAADAAALAGSQMLVHQEDCQINPDDPNCALRNWEVIDAVEDYAERNGVDPNELSIYYTDINGNILADAKFDLGRNAVINETTFSPDRAEGIRVEANRLFDTYLVRVIGRNEMTASAKSQGILACGACSAEDLFPLAIHRGTFASLDPENSLPVYGQTYRVTGKNWPWRTNNDKSGPGPGNFAYLAWQRSGNNSTATLCDNMANTSNSGRWSVNNTFYTGPGVKVKNQSCVNNELTTRIAGNDPSRPAEVTIPIIDGYTGSSWDLTYNVVGFARFRIECFHFWHQDVGHVAGGSCGYEESDHSRWIEGKFIKWVEPTGTAGCTNFGVCTAVPPPPLEETRALVGNVTPWRVFVQQGAVPGDPNPVDVVHVLDISGSMCYNWDGSGSVPSGGCTYQGRIRTAKDVLTGFNDSLLGATFKIKVTNNLAQGLSHVTLGLPAGSTALWPDDGTTYTGQVCAPNCREEYYNVENTTNNPFHGIKYDFIGDDNDGDGVKNGDYDIFIFKVDRQTMDAIVAADGFQVEAKAAGNQSDAWLSLTIGTVSQGGFTWEISSFVGSGWGAENQAGLASYPTINWTSGYETDCWQALGPDCTSGPEADCYRWGGAFYYATKDVAPTGDIGYINQVLDGLVAYGGTSMPLGLQYGRELLEDDNTYPNNLDILLLTTDGMPNIKLDGEWTGYRGKYQRPPRIIESGCNDSVYNAAIQQANLAKQEGIVVFTIGIADNIDEALMRAIASPDTHPDKPHFFQAIDGADFQDIYNQILDRLPKLGTEECIANEDWVEGAGAIVTLYDDAGNFVAQTTADFTGGFIFPDVAPGMYQLEASWLDTSFDPPILYDVMTWTLGGDPATGPIWVEIPEGYQTTEVGLYLRTDVQFTCD